MRRFKPLAIFFAAVLALALASTAGYPWQLPLP